MVLFHLSKEIKRFQKFLHFFNIPHQNSMHPSYIYEDPLACLGLATLGRTPTPGCTCSSGTRPNEWPFFCDLLLSNYVRRRWPAGNGLNHCRSLLAFRALLIFFLILFLLCKQGTGSWSLFFSFFFFCFACMGLASQNDGTNPGDESRETEGVSYEFLVRVG